MSQELRIQLSYFSCYTVLEVKKCVLEKYSNIVFSKIH